MIDSGRKVASFQDWVDSFDLDILSSEERETLQKGARNLVLNPTLQRMLAQLEADTIVSILRASDDETVLRRHARWKATQEFKRQVMGLVQDLNFEKKQSQKRT